MSTAVQLQDELYGGGAGGGVNLYGDGIFGSLFSKGASFLARTGAKAAAKAAARAAARGAKVAAKTALIAQKQVLRKAGTFARSKISRAAQIAKKRGLSAIKNKVVNTAKKKLGKSKKVLIKAGKSTFRNGKKLAKKLASGNSNNNNNSNGININNYGANNNTTTPTQQQHGSGNLLLFPRKRNLPSPPPIGRKRL